MMPFGLTLSGTGAAAEFDALLAAAQAAEAAGFDFVCLPERPGLDPVALSAALAAATDRIGLIPSCSAPFHNPYNLARRMASIDHISRGRFGWALQPEPPAQECERFGHVALPAPDDAAPCASEFATVIAGLWDSWDDDAFMRDKATGLYFDRAKFHWLDHDGPHYRVRGPLDTARPPQGRPPLMVTGGTPAADALAVMAAETLQVMPRHLAEARASRMAVSRGLDANGRPADALCLLAGFAPAGLAVPAGPVFLSEGPAMLAAMMREWIGAGAVDGFVMHVPESPDIIAGIGAALMPALRRHGLRDADGASGPLRARLGLAAAPSRYAA